MDDTELTALFTRRYYASRADWQTRYLGYTAVKCPTDLWTIQEIIVETEPDLVVELGTFAGGSALFYADVLARNQGSGEVITIDITEPDGVHGKVDLPWPPHRDNLIFLRTSSLDQPALDFVTNRIDLLQYSRVMVLLDSQHEAYHVRRELELWSHFVTPGCYLVVEDTVINGHPVRDIDAGDPVLQGRLQKITSKGGPMEALDSWLSTQPYGAWEVDRTRERHLLTYNPRGYLRRC